MCGDINQICKRDFKLSDDILKDVLKKFLSLF